MWRLAWRNLWRNRTRTVILLTAIALPYAMMIVTFGIVGDYLRNMKERAAETAGGTVLVHGDGYWDTQSNDIVLDRARDRLEAVDAVDGVDVAIPRVLIRGMISSSRGASGGQVTGIVEEREAKLRDLSKYLVEGAFLTGEHDKPIVLGKGLAETLEVELGDKVVLTASDSNGEVTRALFRLRGVVETPSDRMNDTVAFTTLEAAQRALRMEGKIHQIGVVAKRGWASDAVADRVQAALGSGAGGIEILTWQEAMPEMVSYLAVERGGSWVMIIVVFAIVAFVIANTFLMSVMERVREFGLFSALGLNHWRIGGLVFAETLVLTGLAVAVGFALGLGGHFAIDQYGIDVAEIFGGEMQLSGVPVADLVMRSEIAPMNWLAGTIGVVVLVFLSAAYPAWKAMRLAPTEAMEFYEQ